MRKEGRLTPYRRAVLEILRSIDDHPTAAEVFRLLRRRRPGVAYATIYNSLNWLKHRGLVGELNFDQEAARFDPIVARHDHLVCTECGALENLQLKVPTKSLQHAGRQKSFRVQRYRIELFGVCRQCAKSIRPRPAP
jgi:Fur family peroxide stress response transcriptional regulator